MSYYITYKYKNNKGFFIKKNVKNIKEFILNKQTFKKWQYEPLYKTFYFSKPDPLLQHINKIDRQVMEKLINEAKNVDKSYREFYIPKRSGGYRHIQAPNPKLYKLQKKFYYFLYYKMFLYPNDSAHAFIKGRDNVTNARMHKYSNYIVKIDLKNFFKSIKKELLEKHLTLLSPFAIIKVFPTYTHTSLISSFLDTLLEISTLNGSLPQGSPLSPMLSNLFMTTIDYQIKQLLKTDPVSNKFVVYTRYADDLTFSSTAPINLKKLIKHIQSVLPYPIRINKKKIKYLNIKNRTFVTGVKLNQNHDATFGHEKKKQLKHDLFKLFMSRKEDTLDLEHAQRVLGRWAYLHKIEPDYAKYLARKYLTKFNANTTSLHEYLLK